MGEVPDLEGAVAASAVVAVGSRLGLCFMALVLVDASDTAGDQILVAASATGGIHHN
jgi:hypothetical protein